MNKICIIGRHAIGKKEINGQTIKTEILTNELIDKYGLKQVSLVDTACEKKQFILLFVRIIKQMIYSKNIIIMPAHNGIKVIAPLVVFLNTIIKRKLHYVVIGGWIGGLLTTRKWLKHCLMKFDCIYVETTTLKKSLEQIGFTNVIIMPNFKRLEQPKQIDELARLQKPYKLCTFSRVMKDKGIEDAIDCVKDLNRNEINYILDIFGPIDGGYIEEFARLQSSFPSYIRYRGTVNYDKTISVLKEYTFLLFPTLFYTEGVPGTIIDAYAAALPVIASEWESFDDVISNGNTGIGYNFGRKEELKVILQEFLNDQSTYSALTMNCARKYNDFSPEVALEKLELV